MENLEFWEWIDANSGFYVLIWLDSPHEYVEHRKNLPSQYMSCRHCNHNCCDDCYLHDMYYGKIKTKGDNKEEFITS